MESRILLFMVLFAFKIWSAKSQFFSDYPDGGGNDYSGYFPPYDLPVDYKQEHSPAAYPIATTVYSMALMRPLEAMPGKKKVPLYIIPEDALQVEHNKRQRIKRSFGGYMANVKYPEFYGLTDGLHIPAVEIYLNKPITVRQLEANVLAPAGFMVPYHGSDRDWPFPLSTGCLVASIPQNTYVSEDHPITIRKLYAVPSLPEYPTYRPVGNLHNHLHVHGHEDPSAPVNDVLANYFSHARPPHKAQQRGYEPPPVFELVPINNRRGSKRRNGSKNRGQNGKKKNNDDEKSEEEESKEDSEEEDEQEDKKKRRKTTTTSTTTTTTEPTTTSTTTTAASTTTAGTTSTTTEASTTTAAASSIQDVRDIDIIAAFTQLRNRERELDLELGRPGSRTRISASFRDDGRNRDNDRDRDSTRDQDFDRYRDRDSNRDRDVESDRDTTRNRDERRRPASPDIQENAFQEQRDDFRRPTSATRSSTPRTFSPLDDIRQPPNELNRDVTSRRPSTTTSTSSYRTILPGDIVQANDDDREEARESRRPIAAEILSSRSANDVSQLRQQMIQRQISQLQRLLSSLNLSDEGRSRN